MSERTETTVPNIERIRGWQAGVVAGLLGGLGMGVFMSVLMTGVLETAIPALWGLDGGAVGWMIHMINSTVFGVAFAAIAVWWPGTARTVEGGLATGAGFGVVLWIVATGVVMPLWLGAVGLGSPPPVPNLSLNGLLAHLIFGLVLGVSYVLLRGSERSF